MRKVGRMQRTDDMNILLNMSLNTLNIDLMSCHCLVVISFLSLMVKVCSSKCLAARVDPKGSYVCLISTKQNDKLF